MSTELLSLRNLNAAQKRTAERAHRTPVLTSTMLDAMTGAHLFFKCENFQRTGSFKFRGACNAIFSLTDAEAARGIVTHSAGNHAQAVALAARMRGIPAYVAMPRTCPEIKRAAVAGYGGQITLTEPGQAAVEQAAAELREATGAIFLHPYEDPCVIAGQATAAMELAEDVPNLDVLIAPVGGGGLLSGTALAGHYFLPKAKVIGAEPDGADDAFRSLRDSRIHPSIAPNTIADGLLTSLGTNTFAIMREHVDAILTANDDAIRAAMHLIMERMKIVVEPSAAIALAIVLNRSDEFRERRVGIILSGGNVELPFPPA